MKNNREYQELFGRRLAQARRMRGMSLRALAAAVGGKVSYNALHKYEKGQMMPDSTVLIAVAGALDQSTDFFFRPPAAELRSLTYRRKAVLGARDRAAVEAEAADFFERYALVEDVLGLSPRTALPRDGFPVRTDDEVEAAAERLRALWKLGEAPLMNVLGLLEEKGIKVCEVKAPLAFDGLAGWAGSHPLIVINRDFPPDRKRFTALHELAHLVLRFPQTGLAPRDQERLCHVFAGAILLPRKALREELGGRRAHVTTRELVAIKERYGISCQAVFKRAVGLDLIPRTAEPHFWALWRSWGYSTQEPGTWMAPEQSSRFEELVYRAAGEEQITLSKGAALLRISVADFMERLRVVE